MARRKKHGRANPHEDPPFWKWAAPLGLVVLLVVAAIYVGFWFGQLPQVRFDALSKLPVECAGPSTDWKYVPVSDVRCVTVIEGIHHNVWVAPQGTRGD